MISAHHLKLIPIFHTLTDTELQDLSKICIVRSVKKGETLFQAGDRRENFYIQLSGQMHIFRTFNEDVQTLSLLDQNEFAVETALAHPQERHEHTAEMLEDGELLVISGKSFSAFRVQHPAIAGKIDAEIIANLTNRLHHANNKILTIYYTGRVASTFRDLDHLSDLLLETIMQITRARRAALIFFQPLEGEAVIRDARGYHSDQEMRNLKVSLNDDPILGPLFHTGREVAISEEQFKSERALHTPYASRNMLAVPLKVEEKVIGAFLLGDKSDGREFSHNNQILLNIIAHQVALAISTAKKAEEQK
ncbi:MAG: GAF domain-containing protein [bacterium]